MENIHEALGRLEKYAVLIQDHALRLAGDPPSEVTSAKGEDRTARPYEDGAMAVIEDRIEGSVLTLNYALSRLNTVSSDAVPGKPVGK